MRGAALGAALFLAASLACYGAPIKPLDPRSAAAKLAGDEGRKAAADGWLDAFEAAGLEHGAALSAAYAVWERQE